MILVFGRHGQVANELRKHPDVMALSRSDCDLTQSGVAETVIARLEPEAVINAAAWTSVDLAETKEVDARRLNAEAPREIARACAIRDIPLLHVSTDYVFDGSGVKPWKEEDPCLPVNAYGRTKLAGEEAVKAAGGRYAILRTSWVFSVHGTNFVKNMLRLSETRSHLDIVSDQIGGPTPAANIATTLQIIASAMIEGHSGGLYHYSGAPEVSWASFAQEIFRIAGRAVTVGEIPTSSYPTPASRPLNSRLNCAKLATDFGINQPSWQDGLSQVIKELEA